ncbi:hypothetical protein DSC45_16230 [Streptomyces sp. YIM 130001]|nr:hypothetical protein DSC45_16230 [Streptomyces sp. YIM 130001]
MTASGIGRPHGGPVAHTGDPALSMLSQDGGRERMSAPCRQRAWTGLRADCTERE